MIWLLHKFAALVGFIKVYLSDAHGLTALTNARSRANMESSVADQSRHRSFSVQVLVFFPLFFSHLRPYVSLQHVFSSALLDAGVGMEMEGYSSVGPGLFGFKSF
jgi:hypothetical protein